MQPAKNFCRRTVVRGARPWTRGGLGGEFFDAVVAATSLIQAQPEIGAPSSNRRTRRVLVERFPYQVVYRLLEDAIVVVAIAHLKRRPGYRRDRTSELA